MMAEQLTELLIGQAKLSVVLGDITGQSTDGIVNAANPGLMGGGGVDGAIHRAGGPVILKECEQIIARQGRLPTGKAVITTGGNLKAKFIIHTVGPVWHGGSKGEPQLLASAYRESLKVADNNKLTSVSFPSLSTGAYSYPVAGAAEVAVKTVASFLKEEPAFLKEVIFVLFDAATHETYRSALEKLSRQAPPR